MAAPFERLQHFLLIVGSGEEMIEKIDTPFPVLVRQPSYITRHAENFLLVRFDDAKRSLQGVTRCTEAEVISLRYLSYGERRIRMGVSGIDQAGKIKIIGHVEAL